MRKPGRKEPDGVPDKPEDQGHGEPGETAPLVDGIPRLRLPNLTQDENDPNKMSPRGQEELPLESGRQSHHRKRRGAEGRRSQGQRGSFGIAFSDPNIWDWRKWDSSMYLICFILILLLVGIIALIIFFFKRKTGSTIEPYVVVKPGVDRQQYSYLELENGLRIITVKPEDPQDKAVYFSLSVGIGSASDPYPISGLAHLAEHMVLTGSEKYDQSNYLDKVVEKYNGKTNAMTQEFVTTYYFKVDMEGFSTALDVLFNSISKPSLERKNLDKELNNIRSELAMRKFKETSMNYFLLRHLSNLKDNTLFRDGYGDLLLNQTEGEKTQLLDRLTVFIRKYYVPELMTVAVFGNLNQTTIESEVINRFRHLKPEGVKRPLALSDYVPFVGQVFDRVYTIKGNRGRDTFYVNFLLPSSFQYYREMPLEYISFLFTYNSKKSLKQLLIKEGLISDLDDTVSASNFEYQVYTVEFKLTPKGRLKLERLTQILFAYLEKLRREGVTESIYDSLTTISMIHFVYEISNPKGPIKALPTEPLELTRLLSRKLQDTPVNLVLTAERIFQEYKQGLITGLLDLMKPEKAIFVLKSKSFTVAQNITELSDSNKTTVLEKEQPKQPAPSKSTPTISNSSLNTSNNSTPTSNMTFNLTSIEGLPSSKLNQSNNSESGFGFLSFPFAKNINISRYFDFSQPNITVDPTLNFDVPLNYSLNRRVELNKFYYRSSRIDFETIQSIGFYNDSLVRDVDFNITFRGIPSKFDLISLKCKETVNEKNTSEPNTPNGSSSTGPLFKGLARNHLSSRLDESLVPSRVRSISGVERMFRPSPQQPLKEGFNSPQQHVKIKEKTLNVSSNTSTEDTDNSTNATSFTKTAPDPSLSPYELCIWQEVQEDKTDPYPQELAVPQKSNFTKLEARVFHKMYRVSLKPLTSVTLQLTPPMFARTLFQANSSLERDYMELKKMLFQVYFTQVLDAETADYQVSDYNVDIFNQRLTVAITMTGFSGGIKEFSQEILNLLVNDTMQNDVFLRSKDSLLGKFHSMNYSSTLAQARRDLGKVLDVYRFDMTPSPSKLRLYENLLENLTLAEFSKFCQDVFTESGQIYTYFGNINASESLNITVELQPILQQANSWKTRPYTAVNFSKFNTSDSTQKVYPAVSGLSETQLKNSSYLSSIMGRILSPGHRMLRAEGENPRDTNHMYVSYFQIGMQSPQRNVLATIFAKLLNQETFSHIRVKLNLGYVANAIKTDHNHILGVAIVVQGDIILPHQVELHIPTVLNNTIAAIQNMTDKEFKSRVSSIVKDYLKVSKTLGAATAKIGSLVEELLYYNLKPDYKALMSSLHKKDLLDLALDCLLIQPRRLSIEIYAKAKQKTQAVSGEPGTKAGNMTNNATNKSEQQGNGWNSTVNSSLPSNYTLFTRAEDVN